MLLFVCRWFLLTTLKTGSSGNWAPVPAADIRPRFGGGRSWLAWGPGGHTLQRCLASARSSEAAWPRASGCRNHHSHALLGCGRPSGIDWGSRTSGWLRPGRLEGSWIGDRRTEGRSIREKRRSWASEAAEGSTHQIVRSGVDPCPTGMS